MRQLSALIGIGFLAGIILMVFLEIIQALTGNPAYSLLFNFDYIPLIRNLKPTWLFGYIFHFLTSILSVIVLFYFLKIFQRQYKSRFYVLVFALGGGALFFLTALSPQPPDATDGMAWIYWTLAHGIFGIVAGISIKQMKPLEA